MSEESTDANNPAQLLHEATMSPEDCDRMERAAERRIQTVASQTNPRETKAQP